jgi:hypothetical protein
MLQLTIVPSYLPMLRTVVIITMSASGRGSP